MKIADMAKQFPLSVHHALTQPMKQQPEALPEAAPHSDRKLGTLGLVMIGFFWVSAGFFCCRREASQESRYLLITGLSSLAM